MDLSEGARPCHARKGNRTQDEEAAAVLIVAARLQCSRRPSSRGETGSSQIGPWTALLRKQRSATQRVQQHKTPGSPPRSRALAELRARRAVLPTCNVNETQCGCNIVAPQEINGASVLPVSRKQKNARPHQGTGRRSPTSSQHHAMPKFCLLRHGVWEARNLPGEKKTPAPSGRQATETGVWKGQMVIANLLGHCTPNATVRVLPPDRCRRDLSPPGWSPLRDPHRPPQEAHPRPPACYYR